MAITVAGLLEGGYLGGVIQEVLTGRDFNAIARGIRQQFPGTSASTINAIITRAKQSISAAGGISAQGEDYTLPLGSIPINPKRRDLVYAGNERIQYRVTVYLRDSAGVEHPVTVFVNSNTPLSQSQIMQKAGNLAMNELVQSTWLRRRYKNFGESDREPDIVSVTRRF
jgi:hypothetical protein